MIHQHWSVENLNHWKRNATYRRENKAPKRNTRLTVIPFEEFDSLNDAFNCSRDQRQKSVEIITTASPHQKHPSQAKPYLNRPIQNLKSV
ncbi:MAG: hypothetical protein RLZZ245_1454 [Verrucomicrobiota bacterium]